MFYLIVAALLILFYIFVAPNNIKGTLNIMGFVMALVIFLLVMTLAFLRFLQSPPEIFVALFMIPVAYFSIRDMDKLPIKTAAGQADFDFGDFEEVDSDIGIDDIIEAESDIGIDDIVEVEIEDLDPYSDMDENVLDE